MIESLASFSFKKRAVVSPSSEDVRVDAKMVYCVREHVSIGDPK